MRKDRWAKTERIKIKDLPEINCIGMDAFFTPNPLRMFGVAVLPVKFVMIKTVDSRVYPP